MLLLSHGSNLPWLYANTNHSSFQVMVQRTNKPGECHTMNVPSFVESLSRWSIIEKFETESP